MANRLKSSRNRLTPYQVEYFPGNTLFEKIARAVCRAGTLPAKELFESWEVARRVRRKYRGGRIVDLACGHGLLAHIMLLLDDSSPKALAVDTDMPKNAGRLSSAILTKWPRLEGRIQYVQMPMQDISLTPGDLVLSIHACGSLTDTVLDMAVRADAKVAVLPCCHDTALSPTGSLEGWIDGPLAVDIVRAEHLRAAGYQIHTRRIPETITPKNRLLMGNPLMDESV